MLVVTDVIVIHREDVVNAMRKVPRPFQTASNHRYQLMRLLRSSKRDQMTREKFYSRVTDWIHKGRIQTRQNPRYLAAYYLPSLKGMVSVWENVTVEVS